MSKNIVICCDGTGQKLDFLKTNVVRLFTMLDRSDAGKQVAFYHPGIGIVPAPGALTWISRQLTLWAGKLVGYGLLDIVAEAYTFLIGHYSPGDRLYLFGFSRGAFAVRVLAGLLYRCGVLLPDALNLVPYALDLYKPHSYDEKVAGEFKAAFAQDCNVEFVGIWDTVKSFGYFWPRSLPHLRYNPIVKTVRHALAIHERRSFFVHTTWGGLDPPVELRRLDESQDVQEVWFAGSHSDIGGGYEDEKSGLARISLKWIVDEASRCGLLVDAPRKNAAVAFRPDLPLVINPSLKGHWRFAEVVPRWELDNSVSPPKRRFKLGPSGKRQRYTRRGKVLIHASALACDVKLDPVTDMIVGEQQRPADAG